MLKEILGLKYADQICIFAHGESHFRYFMGVLASNSLTDQKKPYTYLNSNSNYQRYFFSEVFVIFLDGWDIDWKTHERIEMMNYVRARKIKHIFCSDMILHKDFLKLISDAKSR